MSMTRDEAIAYGIECAECLVEMRRRGISPARHEIELAELAEAKAALAEPPSETEAEATVRCAQAVLDDPAMRPTFLRLAGLKEEDTKGATLTDWFCFFFNADGRRFRCQHQAADASLDCTEPAVLCETHGGHDACAVEIMRLQARIAEPVDVTTFVNEGRRLARDEIARALDAEAGRHATRSSAPVHGVLGMAAQKVRDGSIREWLPKDDRNAE